MPVRFLESVKRLFLGVDVRKTEPPESDSLRYIARCMNAYYANEPVLGRHEYSGFFSMTGPYWPLFATATHVSDPNPVRIQVEILEPLSLPSGPLQEGEDDLPTLA